MLRLSLIKSLSLASVLLVAGCQEDPEAAANNLFVDASSALSQAEQITGTTLEDLNRRRDLFSAAIENLDQIITDYPSASLAVDLSAVGSAKGIVVSDLKRKLRNTEEQILCAETPLDGNCAVDALIRNELLRNTTAEGAIIRRAPFVLLAAANGRWEAAIDLLRPFADDEKKLKGIVRYSGVVTLSVLLNDPDGVDGVKDFVPEHARARFEEEVDKLRVNLRESGWQATSPITANFTIESPTAIDGLSCGRVINTVEKISRDAGDLFKIGDLNGARAKIVDATMIYASLMESEDFTYLWPDLAHAVLEVVDDTVRLMR